MPNFSEQFIQQVAQATDIVDLVSNYVSLKKKGREFVGLCPFHDDKHPSMNVSPSKQIFKCFACGAGGGVFKFVELYEKMTFPEAVKMLAERANIPLPRESQAAAVAPGLSRDDLLGLMTFAARFFREQLFSPAGTPALEYARRRGLSDESIRRFGLGYAPNFWDGLYNAARREGFGESQLVTAGLVARRDAAEGASGAPSSGPAQKSGCYDRFRHRLMFPIIDPQNRVIAFGGRALDDSERAKYLNSPDTPLFDKSGQLYALNWSREAIASSGQAVVVEGYLDALIPLQAGVSNVVATLGTALTDRHVRLLGRYATEVVLVFDADAAGQAAAGRALEMFLAQRLHVRVATIPSGKDPCDYTLAEGGEAMKALVASAPDALQYAWQRRHADWQAAGGNLASQRQFVEDFLRLVVTSSAYGAIDEVRRGQLAQHIGHILNISPADLQEQMRRIGRTVPRPGAPRGAAADDRAELGRLAGRHVLEVLLNRPELLDGIVEKIGPEDFGDPEFRIIAQQVWKLGRAGRLSLDELLLDEAMSSRSNLLTDLAASGEHRGNYEQTLEGAVEDLLYRRRQKELQELKSAAGTDDDALRKLSQGLASPDVRRRPKIT